MDDSSIDAGLDTPTDSKLPIGLAIAGIVLGGLAFIFAFTAKNQVARLSENVNTQVTELHAELEKALAEVRANGGDSQKFDALAADVEAFKAQVQTNFQTATTSYQNLAATVESMKGTRQAPQRGNAQQSANGNAPTRAAADGEYVIKKGDSLWKIANANGCTVADITSLNPGINPNNLSVGKKIKLPAKR